MAVILIAGDNADDADDQHVLADMPLDERTLLSAIRVRAYEFAWFAVAECEGSTIGKILYQEGLNERTKWSFEISRSEFGEC